jgi:hypothetical protein
LKTPIPGETVQNRPAPNERLGLVAIGVNGVWLRREGDYAIVAVEASTGRAA